MNSNSLKIDAFYHAALPFGKKIAEEFVDYHVTHGGISRFAKFKYFQRTILGRPVNIGLQNKLLAFYSAEVRKGLCDCEIANGLERLREITHDSRWLVVSGGEQFELRDVFAIRKIDYLFDAGIYGSPDDKDTIIQREISCGNIIRPAIYFGDTKYDMEVAKRSGLGFVFVSKWSDCSFSNSEINNLFSIPLLSDLLQDVLEK